MRHVSWLALSAALIGCQEINIDTDNEVEGVPNPPNLETPVRHDKIVQVTTPEVDILWVIDDSCSMSEEQRALRDNFDAFMEFFLDSGLDWHIGVTSTDQDGSGPGKRGELVQTAGYRYLTKDVPNPVALFGQMATLGTSGSATERGRQGAYLALTDPLKSGKNQGFYRDDASLHVVAISDEPDQSLTPSRNEFITWMRGLKTEIDMVSFSAIAGGERGCSGPGGSADASPNYLALVAALDGIFEEICEEDWVPVLEALGLKASGLRREYFLSEVPVAGTIEVWVEDGDYVYEGVEVEEEGGTFDPALCEVDFCFSFFYNPSRNSILIGEEYTPNPLAEINIRYELLSEYEPGEVPDDDDGGNDTGL